MHRTAFACCLAVALAAAGDAGTSTVTVPAGGDLQQALDAARPGQTILLAAGAAYVGHFVLPSRRDGGGGVITLRTGGDGWPAPGERMTPAAGARLARLRSPDGRPALATARGARGWRIELLAFAANRDGAGDVIALGDGSAAQRTLDTVPSDLTLDRLYIRGDPAHGQKRAIALNSARTTIAGCYIAGIAAVGQDSQAVAGWNGPGGYVIENNYLEAAGENIMFGGADPSIDRLTPTDIVVRGNRLDKPIAWRAGGARWQVKNLLELKNARHVVVEGNVMAHAWAQAQNGYAILFTVRNQDGGCPWCQVADVRFRGNVVRDVAAGINILGFDSNHPSRQTTDIVVRDNLFDGIDRRAWGGDGYFLQMGGRPAAVTIDHNTIVQGASNGLVKMGGGAIERFTMTNNLAGSGRYGIIGDDHGIGNDSIRHFLPGAVIAGNVIAGARAAAYPPGNFFPGAGALGAWFADPAAHDYRLKPGSPWAGRATDGRDPGADVERLPNEKGGL